MGRLAKISGREAIGKVGWQVVGQVGSHVVMSKTGIRANLSIPQHKELFLESTSDGMFSLQVCFIEGGWGTVRRVPRRLATRFVPKNVRPSHCKQTASAPASFAASNLKIPSSNPFPLSHLFGY